MDARSPGPAPAGSGRTEDRRRPMTIPKAVCAATLALGIAIAAPTVAQTSFATRRGRTADEQGGVLPGVTVTVRHVETNTTRTAVTDALGQYFLPSLPAGSYDVTWELGGFATASRGVVMRVGQEATLDVVLTLAGVQENVVVSGQAALVETQAV